ncbi:MAG TPA: PLP-dependent aspartate aminotransferase family protein [Chthonomonadaceae bacterium]|nr:PLP-dependent aspartate aminotransferase family protein [Chthonomonadaceae bacterium]
MPEPTHPPDKKPDFETICTHWAEDPAQYQGAITPPIFQNSLFTAPDCETRERGWSAAVVKRGALGETMGEETAELYDYTRISNPTTDIAEAKIAALEQGEQARCFGSGMGAISAAILSCVRAGDHVIAPETVYGPTRDFLSSYLARFNVTASFVDGCDPNDYADAMQPNTTLFYLESPSSLLFKQQDLSALTGLAKERGIATICDNSWASPYFQNPLQWGVDLVVHSATKYLGGHSDIVAGVAVGSAERMTSLRNREGALLGAVLDPFASWLMLRGLRTLALRMERHQQNATRIAHALLNHPAVAAVYYPGLPTDPQPELTCRQLRGTSGLLSVELKAQSKEATYRFVNALRYFGIGCSWGGFESLAIPISIPARLVDKGEGLRWIVRLHIGLESANDLWDDLESALKGV